MGRRRIVQLYSSLRLCLVALVLTRLLVVQVVEARLGSDKLAASLQKDAPESVQTRSLLNDHAVSDNDDNENNDMVRVMVGFKNTEGRRRAFEASTKWLTELSNVRVVSMTIPRTSMERLRRNPNIEFVEEDDIVTPDSERLPPGITLAQGDSSRIPTLSNWTTATSSACSDPDSFKVAIIDSGLETSHPDVPCRNISDLANTNCIGASFGAGTPNWHSPKALAWHGTHVFGTVGAIGGNDQGVSSMLPDSTGICYLIARIFDDEGNGQFASVVFEGIDWAISQGAHVINISSSGPRKTQTGQVSFDTAYANGGLAVASAGNLGGTDTLYPAGFDRVLGVAAVNNDGTHAYFSQANSKVDIAAPGVDILSTTVNDSYKTTSGTSMSAPHVTGAIARVWSVCRQCSNVQVERCLLSTATGGSFNKTDELGFGLLQTEKAYDCLVDSEQCCAQPTDIDYNRPQEQAPNPVISKPSLQKPVETQEPSEAPSPSPTRLPTPSPSPSPTTSPTVSPTPSPSTSPTTLPTTSPSNSPNVEVQECTLLLNGAFCVRDRHCCSGLCTAATDSARVGSTSSVSICQATQPPSQAPSAAPTSDRPSSSPSNSLAPSTDSPSASPSTKPSVVPSAGPSMAPSTSPSVSPSAVPSASPSATPSASPSASPSTSPSVGPSATPSASPSTSPSASPSTGPSAAPSTSPSAGPSAGPSAAPSMAPSASPSVAPSATPSVSPSISPSATPSTSLSASPSTSPSAAPSSHPTTSKPPSSVPSSSPSTSHGPSSSPSSQPSTSLSPTSSAEPSSSAAPSSAPSDKPSAWPSSSPSTSVAPSSAPTIVASEMPSQSVSPSLAPTEQSSSSPSVTQSNSPSLAPTKQSSSSPSVTQSNSPSQVPSSVPSVAPTPRTTRAARTTPSSRGEGGSSLKTFFTNN